MEQLIGKYRTQKLISEVNDSNINELASKIKNNTQKIEGYLQNYIFYKNKL